MNSFAWVNLLLGAESSVQRDQDGIKRLQLKKVGIRESIERKAGKVFGAAISYRFARLLYHQRKAVGSADNRAEGIEDTSTIPQERA